MTQTFWEHIHQNQEWGKYPDIDVVRLLLREFPELKIRNKMKTLDLGCGAGANSLMMASEGFEVHGIDFSQSAINNLYRNFHNQRLEYEENNFKVGDFRSLPWNDNTFDVVVDCMALYANTSETIEIVVGELQRVIKKGGRLISRSWGLETKKFSGGQSLEHNTIDCAAKGPCKGFGISHFFSQKEIERLFIDFDLDCFLKTTRRDLKKSQIYSEWTISGIYLK